MVAGHVSTIKPDATTLSYRAAGKLADGFRRGLSLVVDLAEIDNATTAGLAKLVVLRGALRRGGGDLRLANLHGRVRRLYELNRLGGVLPCEL